MPSLVSVPDDVTNGRMNRLTLTSVDDENLRIWFTVGLYVRC